MGQTRVSRRDFLGASALAAGLATAASGAQQPTQETRPMKVKFGLNLLVYSAAFTKDDVHLIKKVADMGYDGVEVLFADLGILDTTIASMRCCLSHKG